jgi:hypothetical protein
VSKEQYEKWVDYVNCRYLVAYIDKKITQKDGIGNDYKRDYIEKNRSKLDINSPDKAPNYDGIKKIIGKFQQGEQLHEYINEKKGGLDKKWNKDKLTEYLLELPTDMPNKGGSRSFNGFLSNTTDSLREVLQERIIPDDLFTSSEPIAVVEALVAKPKNENKNFRQNRQNDEPKPPQTKSDKSSFPWDWVIVFVAGTVGGVWLREKWVGKNNSGNAVEQSLRNEISDLKNDKEQVENKIKQLESTIKNSERQYKKLFEENIQLGQQMDAYQSPKSSVEMNAEQNRENQPVYSQTNHSTETSVSTLYADSIFDGFFNKTKETPNEETVFELHLQNAQNATFRIYNSAKPRIIANPAFLEGCDKQVLANAQNVKIVNEGSAQRQADGKWKIVTKLNVIIN